MKQIHYAIDTSTGLICSRYGNEMAIEVLDFEHMSPENGYETKYNLEKFSVSDVNFRDLRFTKKIPIEAKNKHRAFWGLKPLPMRPQLIGQYNHQGYSISEWSTQQVLYEAGNNPYESTGVIDKGLPLSVLKRHCERTGFQMAREMKGMFFGAVRIEDVGESGGVVDGKDLQ